LLTRRNAVAGKRLRLAVKLRGGAFRGARRALEAGQKRVLLVRVGAADASGNTSKRVFRVVLRPPRP
jgi:hypothetical protein